MKTPLESLEQLVLEIPGYAGAAIERAVYGAIGAAHAFQMTGAIDMNEAFLWGERARLAGVRKGWVTPEGISEEALVRQIEAAARVAPPPPAPEADPQQTSASAVPQPGETRTTVLPASLDGIRFTIGRMIQYIQDGRKDPLVIATARKIAGLANTGHRPKGAQQHLRQLRGIHAWCVANFAYVNDPVNVELIQTPNRMLRELEIPAHLHKAIWSQVGKALGGKMPPARMTGDADEATLISLALAAAIGIEPLRIVLGGTEGTAHTCWGAAYIGRWLAIDVLHPRFGAHQKVQEIEHVDVPL